MGKKSKKRGQSDGKPARPPKNIGTWVVTPTPAREPKKPVSLFGYEMAWAKLVAFRFVLFGLFATDAVLQVSHAPRYGAGGFNVPNLPFVDSGNHTTFLVLQLLLAFVLALASVGIGNRIGLPIATVAYGYVYFGSQLDSYQHHYLVWLVLLLSCFQLWQRPLGTPPPEPDMPVRAWPLKLILVQLGIVYFWAALSKMDAAWLDGRTLGMQLKGELKSLIDTTIGIAGAAKLTTATELFLAVAVWWRRAWKLALPVGVALHIGIVKSDLEIGLFAYMMLGFYLLLVPDQVFIALGRAFAGVAAVIRLITPRGWGRWITGSGGFALCLVLAWDARIPKTFVVALGVSIAVIIPVLWGGAAWLARAGVAMAFASILVIVVDLVSDTAVDYYRFWGGTTRRLGDVQASEDAYRRVTEIAPDEPAGHYQLGKLMLARGDDAGLAYLQNAQRLEPNRARAYIEEAQWLRTKGRTAEALDKAKEATYAEPSNSQAQRLVDVLSGLRGTPDPIAPEDNTE